MKCLNCNVLVLGDESIENCRKQGHAVLTVAQASEFYTIANKLDLLDADMKHRIINGGGPIDM